MPEITMGEEGKNYVCMKKLEKCNDQWEILCFVLVSPF